MKNFTNSPLIAMMMAGSTMVRLSSVPVKFQPPSFYHLCTHPHAFRRSYWEPSHWQKRPALAKGSDLDTDWMTQVFYPHAYIAGVHSLKVGPNTERHIYESLGSAQSQCRSQTAGSHDIKPCAFCLLLSDKQVL